MSEDAMMLCDRLRAAGWLVASHNDYRAGATLRTYWAFSRRHQFIDGDGQNDFCALLECTAQAKRLETYAAISGVSHSAYIDPIAYEHHYSEEQENPDG